MGKTCSLLVATSLAVSISAVGAADEIATGQIDVLKLQQADVPEGFYLNQEKTSGPGAALGERAFEKWRRASSEQPLLLVEAYTDTPGVPFAGTVDQNWYRGANPGEKDKIEADLWICASVEQRNSVISSQTTQQVASQFAIAPSPFAGEKSWHPVEQMEHRFLVLFSRSNVVVRLYVRMYGLSQEEVVQAARELAVGIDTKIVLEMGGNPEFPYTVVEREEGGTVGMLQVLSLSQNWPNPFNASTTLQLSVSERGLVDLSVHSLTGQEVATLLREVRDPGRYMIRWDGRDWSGALLASGVYLCRLRASGRTDTRKVLLVR